MERKAVCSCGQFGLRVVGEPTMVAACSCMECQRRTGAVFGVMAFFKNDLVIEKLGECKSFERASDSGLGATTYSENLA